MHKEGSMALSIGAFRKRKRQRVKICVESEDGPPFAFVVDENELAEAVKGNPL